MKASELIRQLQSIVDREGDKEVVVNALCGWEYFDDFEIYFDDYEIYIDGLHLDSKI